MNKVEKTGTLETKIPNSEQENIVFEWVLIFNLEKLCFQTSHDKQEQSLCLEAVAVPQINRLNYYSKLIKKLSISFL